MKTRFSYSTMFWKGARSLAMYLIPFIPVMIALIPPQVQALTLLDVIEWCAPFLGSLTVGSLLVMGYNFLKVRLGVKLP